MEIVLFLLVLLAAILSSCTALNLKRRDTRIDLLEERIRLSSSTLSSMQRLSDMAYIYKGKYTSLEDHIEQLINDIPNRNATQQKDTTQQDKTSSVELS